MSIEEWERSKLEQDGADGTLNEVYLGVGVGVPLFVISLVLLARNLWLAAENKKLKSTAVAPPARAAAERAAEPPATVHV